MLLRLTLYSAVRHHEELILCRQIAGIHIVDFRVDAHIGGANKNLCLNVRILFHQSLDQTYRRVLFVFDTKQQFVLQEDVKSNAGPLTTKTNHSPSDNSL
jgi:hypothetical protein